MTKPYVDSEPSLDLRNNTKKLNAGPREAYASPNLHPPLKTSKRYRHPQINHHQAAD